jgi:hypothetical protein
VGASGVGELPAESDGGGGGRVTISMVCHPDREGALRWGRVYRAEAVDLGFLAGGAISATTGGATFTAGGTSGGGGRSGVA